MTSAVTESKRIRNLRTSIVNQIPKFPNDKATKQILEGKSLGSLFIDYINWACRYVPSRQRKIHLEQSAVKDHRWNTMKQAVDSLLNKVENGDDLTPHLSLQAHKHGFTPTAATTAPVVNKWADKDFLLNVMGFHHFHLGLTIEAAGHVERTDNVLFAAVTRDSFRVLAICDHSVFDKVDKSTQVMTSERERIWDIFLKWSSNGLPPGSAFIPSMIMTSGHSYNHVQLADYYAKLIRHFDSQIDDKSFVDNLYNDAGIPVPVRPKLKWSLEYLDIGLLDEAQSLFLYFTKGQC